MRRSQRRLELSSSELFVCGRPHGEKQSKGGVDRGYDTGHQVFGWEFPFRNESIERTYQQLVQFGVTTNLKSGVMLQAIERRSWKEAVIIESHCPVWSPQSHSPGRRLSGSAAR
jgi:hypothetical protein